MKPRVYVETTVISYLTARATTNVVALARQQITRRWWADRGADFELVSSRLSELELGRGDGRAAAARVEVVRALPYLAVDERVDILAARLIGPGAIPAKATDDAVHLATCAVHAVPYLLT